MAKEKGFELSEKDELELLMLEKERRRRLREDRAKEIDDDRIKSAKELAVDIPVGVAQGATLGFADEIYGAGASAIKGTDYESERDAARDVVKKARERSPVGTFAGEMIGGSVYGGGGAMRTAGLSAAMAAGESEEESIAGISKDTIVGGTIGGLGHKAVDLLKMPFIERDITRAKFLGQTSADFERIGENLGDPLQMTRELEKADLFKHTVGKLDPKTLKFKSKDVAKGSSVDLIPTRRDVKRTVESGLKTVSNEKKKIFKKIKKPIDRELLLMEIAESLKDLQQNAKDPTEFNRVASDEIKSLLNRLGDSPSVADLEKAKQIWQNLSSDMFLSARTDPKFKSQAEIQKRVSSVLKDAVESFVEQHAGIRDANRIIDLNRLGQNLHQAKRGLRQATGAGIASGSGIEKAAAPYSNIGFQVMKAGEFIGGGEKGQLLRAKTGDVLEGIIPEGIEREIKQAPARVISREPQSIPEQLVRYKIPRDSQQVLAEKETILQKIAQQAPEMFDHAQEIFNNSPDKVSDLLPVLAQMAPHLLEDDKYGRIDGKILDPIKKEMAREDIKLNDELSNSQKAILINQINKTGDYPL